MEGTRALRWARVDWGPFWERECCGFLGREKSWSETTILRAETKLDSRPGGPAKPSALRVGPGCGSQRKRARGFSRSGSPGSARMTAAPPWGPSWILLPTSHSRGWRLVHTSERTSGLGPAPRTGRGSSPSPSTSQLNHSRVFSLRLSSLLCKVGGLCVPCLKVFVRIKRVDAFRAAWRTHKTVRSRCLLLVW